MRNANEREFYKTLAVAINRQNGLALRFFKSGTRRVAFEYSLRYKALSANEKLC